MNMNGTFVESSKIKANQAKKDRFGLPDKKECSLNQKKEVLKNDKRVFSNWLVHGFCQKIELFIISVFGQNKPERIVLWYSGEIRMLSRPEKRSFKKVHKIEIFQRA